MCKKYSNDFDWQGNNKKLKNCNQIIKKNNKGNWCYCL